MATTFLRATALRSSLRLRAGGKSAKAGGGKSKKSKGGAAEAAALPVVPKEQRVGVTLGANIGKEGKDPPVLPDADYPPWLWRLLDKPASLSELKRKMDRVGAEAMEIPELRRYLTLDNRRRIKENNALRAKG